MVSVPSVAEVPTFDTDLHFSVDDAYSAIPHRRTEMDFDDSSVPSEERAYLSVAFATIDQAILLRVDTLHKLLDGNTHQSAAVRRLGTLLEFFETIHPPKRLLAYHHLIEKTISEERAFFQEWEEQGTEFVHANPSTFSSDANFAAASADAKAAYSKLMQLYPAANSHNKDAFFDYHCALDFQ